MSRRLPDWLDGYMEFTENTESARAFHKWSAISAISAVLRRKVSFAFGRIKLFPNLYILLIAEPGIARKSQAISFCEDIVREVPEIVLSADATTPQALLEDMELAAKDAMMPDNTVLRHSSLAIFSGEFESFLGSKKDNDKMLITLTDFYDGRNRPFKYRTKHAGSNVIPDIYLSILAATTPESLANCLPSKAIGGGLTSRMLFIWADAKAMKVAIPELSQQQKKIAEELLIDLTIMSRIVGRYRFSPEGQAWWIEFYNDYDERSSTRACKDPAFSGWYSRKPINILKTAIICAASESNELLLCSRHCIRAKELIEETEIGMGRAFSAVGRSEVTAEVDLVRGIVAREGMISEKRLLQRVWRDIDAKKFDNVMQTIMRSGDVMRSFRGPKGEDGIWYKWSGGNNNACG